MSIEKLIAAVPPPSAPYEAFSGPWEPVETRLGTDLPQDYKDFARLYGSGYFLGIFIVYVPSTEGPHLGLEAEVRQAHRNFSENEKLPYALWPDKRGLVKFGMTDVGDQLYWLPEGSPDNWKVVFWDRGMPEGEEFEAFDCGMAEFLAGLTNGTFVPRGYSRGDLTDGEPTFEPFSDDPEDP